MAPKDFSKDIAAYEARQKSRRYWPHTGTEFPFTGYSEANVVDWESGSPFPGGAPRFPYPVFGQTPADKMERERKLKESLVASKSIISAQQKLRAEEEKAAFQKEEGKLRELTARETFETATPVSGPETRSKEAQALAEMEYAPGGDEPYSSVAEQWDSADGVAQLLAMDKKKGLAPGTSRKAIEILSPREQGTFRGQGYPEERFAYGGMTDLAQEVTPGEKRDKPYRFQYPGEGKGIEEGKPGYESPKAQDVLEIYDWEADDLAELEATELKETAAPPPLPGSDNTVLTIETGIIEDLEGEEEGEWRAVPELDAEGKVVPDRSSGIEVTGSYDNAMAGRVSKFIPIEGSRDPEATTAISSFFSFIFKKYGLKMFGRRYLSTAEEQLAIYPPHKAPQFYKNGANSEHTFEALNEAGNNRIFNSAHVKSGLAIDVEMRRLGELSPEFAMLVRHGNQFGLYFDMIKSEEYGGTDGIEWWHWSYNPDAAAKQAEEWAKNPEAIPGQRHRSVARMGQALPKDFGKEGRETLATKTALDKAHGGSLEDPLAKRIREILALEGPNALPKEFTKIETGVTPAPHLGAKLAEKPTPEGAAEAGSQEISLEGMKDHLGKMMVKAEKEGGPIFARRTLMAEKDNLAAKYNHATLSEMGITREIHVRQTLVEEELEESKIRLAEAERQKAQMERITGEVLTKFEVDQVAALTDSVDTQMADGLKMLDDLKKTQIDPWRMFGFWDVVQEKDPKTGKMVDVTKLSKSKTAITLGSIAALLGNLFLSTASALKGKGQIPLYIYDMLSDSIDRDVTAQIESLQNKRHAVNSKFTAAGVLQNVHKNRMVIARQLRTQMVKQAELHLNDMMAGMTLERDKEVIKQTVPLLNAEYLKGVRATYKESLDVLKEPRDFQMQGLRDQEIHEGQLRGQWLSIYGYLARTNKNKGLSKLDEELIDKITAFRPLLDRYKLLWEVHGRNLNVVAKIIAEKGLGPFDSRTMMTLPRWAKSKALAALQELETIRESNAAIMHAFSGDKGPVAVQEQWFAKGRLPMGHDYDLGNELIARMYAFFDMVEKRSYLAMPDVHRKALNATISSLSGNPVGMTTAMRKFTAESGQSKTTDLPTSATHQMRTKEPARTELTMPSKDKMVRAD